ncbi:DHS-like NAD/FAD-binding domain-containing protein [Mycena rosella]|uniref:DHS-like NAD/FAD-binding domain-containing protein n=1 Tax=Mycena rosella TaxID=1033263 RepID=A0AAD7GU81_MYCRO|nr:DHS-like NAD/FAD-binding domain-containing protein [Mycena rosella]
MFSWFRSAPPLLSKDLEGVAAYIARPVNAGISSLWLRLEQIRVSRAAGIPDFRSQGGLYETLRKRDIDVRRPQDIFTLSYSKQNPKPSYKLISELYGGTYRPTLTPSFLRLLDKKRVLNLLEPKCKRARAPRGRAVLIEAHGTLDSQYCTTCHAKFDDRKMKAAVVSGDIPPDVIIFGEKLPLKFWLNLPFLKRADQ